MKWHSTFRNRRASGSPKLLFHNRAKRITRKTDWHWGRRKLPAKSLRSNREHLSGASLFLKSPETFWVYFGTSVPFMSLQTRGSYPSNVAIFLVFLALKHVKRSAFQDKWIAVWQLSFRAQNVLGTYKHVPGPKTRPGAITGNTNFWLVKVLSVRVCTFQESRVRFHAVGLKCMECCSYNTSREGEEGFPVAAVPLPQAAHERQDEEEWERKMKKK